MEAAKLDVEKVWLTSPLPGPLDQRGKVLIKLRNSFPPLNTPAAPGHYPVWRDLTSILFAQNHRLPLTLISNVGKSFPLPGISQSRIGSEGRYSRFSQRLAHPSSPRRRSRHIWISLFHDLLIHEAQSETTSFPGILSLGTQVCEP